MLWANTVNHIQSSKERKGSQCVGWLVRRLHKESRFHRGRKSRPETHERIKRTHDLMDRVALNQAYRTQFYSLWTRLYQTNGPTALTDDDARNLSL